MNKSVLISKYTINEVVKSLAGRISRDFKNEELILICILKGSFIFCADLIRKIKNVDTKITFIEISSYINHNSSGKIILKRELDYDIFDKNVLIVEDILDSGNSLNYLYKYLIEKNPKILKTCVLLDKPERREIPFQPDYVGIEIPDKFVIGYGLDDNDSFRGIPDLRIVE